MDFRLLGVLEAGSSGQSVDLGPPKQRALLAILLLHLGEIVPVDRIVELLWGEEPPRTAPHSIQIYVSELRKVLEPAAGRRLIVTRTPGYLLDAPPEWIDTRRFEALIREGSEQLAAGNGEQGIASLRSALALWRGPALSDFAYEEFAQPYVRRFGDMHLDAVETLASAEIDAGRIGPALPLLEAAIRDDPLRERSRELLMLALYRAGRHAEALTTYQTLRTLLDEELGLEPSPPLQRLRDRILLHDPSLVPSEQSAESPHDARNPYKGLQAFGETDADDFFGRETLVERLVSAVESGQRLIAVVGPSGSGKSSVVSAGLLPRIRALRGDGSASWKVSFVSLGPDPIADVRVALKRLLGSATADATEEEAAEIDFATVTPGVRALLVMDHFEQLFAAADDSRRDRFLASLARAVQDPAVRLTVVLALRADFYDRPLQHPAFSGVFVPAVVHVLPMTPSELEAAAVEPASRVGVTMEPGLLAELVAETASSAGTLPLLQYALTELFERRTGAVLTLASYRALGGMRGVLTRRAEDVFTVLSADEQPIATQVFLRLVRLGHGTADARRRATVSELSDLEIDPVGLSSVLTTFARHRLLTFDHEPTTGRATVEVAHEALLTEWDRLAGWIERHRTALRRHEALLSAVEEWESSGRDEDYLPAGNRLSEFVSISHEGGLQLTTQEREFLDAAVRRRDAGVKDEAARIAAQRRAARRGRVQLAALAVSAVALVGIGGFAFLNRAPSPVAYAWTTDGVVSAQAVTGFDRAVTEFGLEGQKFSQEELEIELDRTLGERWWAGLADDEAFGLYLRFQQDELRRLAESGVGLIIVEGIHGPDVDVVALEYPDTHFGVVIDGNAPNVASMTFIEAEASFLAGAAAAMKSTTGTIGYIAGVVWHGLWGFEAGYAAGARYVNPDIEILVEHLSVTDLSGFDDKAKAREVALEMYAEGADIVMHAAGNSGFGLFDAAAEYSETSGRHVWAIGVDADQFITVLREPGVTDPELWQQHILTSVLKENDAIAYALVAQHARGEFTAGSWNWGLASGGVGISYSGGYIDDVRSTLEDLKAQVIAGEIVVPCIPEGHEQEAAELGIGPDDCRTPSDAPSATALERP